ncbi:selenide, water dikinase SelD [Jhaorihella thermophila]|uniref:Selenide, water dikinase n=1 Tax=Jhaorihella thermophila TaxID=488547 RepID=A0A1H5XXP1_9RHOB|nr:selenide, water dikinase SelD [Jhaorihella thermophila]SEG16471.1 selenide, water dikinase [Jhaorihella thermophila]
MHAMPRLPLTRDLVLVGGGHAHALVLRKWGMQPLPGARVTVINPGPTAPYSGMLPGFVAGHYTRSDLDIDLVRLARFAGARVILGAVEGMDLKTRQIHVAGRPPIGYDVASVNVGITSAMPDLPGFAEHAVPAKPLGEFAARWADYRDRTGPARVAVIGGGVAGAEIAMAMAFALRQRGRETEIHLIDAARALSALVPRAQRLIRARMSELGVTLIEHAPIARIAEDHVELADGRHIAADFVTGAAGARPYGWFRDTGLALHDGFIAVDETLRTSDPAVFAAGDCAHLTHAPRPKAGVYAVREAPVLFDNLCATLSGHRLRPYRPQKDYLKLVSLGGKEALAEKFGTAYAGRLMWRWKDRIDRRFMEKFRDLPAMEPPELPPMHAEGLPEAIGDKPMCGGCGAKVGRAALRAGLAPVAGAARSDIEPLPGDDAALLKTGGARQVISSDHLRAMVEDPAVMTRIAAVHALGDVWAMAAQPQAATASLILPRMSPELQERTLAEIMAAAQEVMGEAGAAIVGGHTSMGDELTVGFTVTGLCDGDPVTLAGGRPGDALILTKPLGSGVLMAAEMGGRARGDWVADALALMCQPQGAASRILSGAHAMTDVTGFGLAGHLMGLCEASGCAAELYLDDIPLMRGAAELAEAGIRSILFPQNRALALSLPAGGRHDLLFDPQTAGGLLAAVERAQAAELLAALHEAGYHAALVGMLREGDPQITGA